MADAPLAPRCVLVVPCFNEARRLDRTAFLEFLANVPAGFQMLFVDDGSSDGTLEVLESIRKGAANSVLILPKSPNGGKAEAVRFGINFALEHLDPVVVGFWDADLATPLPAVFDLLGVLGENPGIQMVFGARIKLLGRHVDRRIVRHYIGRVFATAVSNVLALPVYDTQCGAKLFRVSSDFRGIMHEPFLSRWIFDVEIIARFIAKRGAAWVHDSIYEYPLKQWQDVSGSKLRPADFVKAIGEMVAIYRKYLHGSGERRPPDLP